MFQMGDRVMAFGSRGNVHSLSSNGLFVMVKFDDFDSLVVFNTDGKMFKWNKKPILKKVKKNEKTTK